jgi:hypothetical protein
MSELSNNNTPVPLVAPDAEVTDFLQVVVARYIQSTPPERLRAQLPSAAHIDSLAAGLEKRGLDGDEFKGRLFARLDGRKYEGHSVVHKPSAPPIASPSPIASEAGASNAIGMSAPFTFRGKEYHTRSLRSFLAEVLSDLANEDATFLARFAASERRRGKIKYLAKTREEIFGAKEPDWIQNRNTISELPGGWLFHNWFTSQKGLSFLNEINAFIATNSNSPDGR